MWIRPQHVLAARMPSTRSQPLNPRLVEPASSPEPAKPLPTPEEAKRQAENDAALERAAAAARAGGFHESSYELSSGLDINESEWPPDTTIPGALAGR